MFLYFVPYHTYLTDDDKLQRRIFLKSLNMLKRLLNITADLRPSPFFLIKLMVPSKIRSYALFCPSATEDQSRFYKKSACTNNVSKFSNQRITFWL